MTQDTGKRTFSPYVGKRFDCSKRGVWLGLAPLPSIGGAYAGAVEPGVRGAEELHIADRDRAEPADDQHDF